MKTKIERTDVYQKVTDQIVAAIEEGVELFADDVLIVHSDGTTDTKSNFVEALSSGRLKMKSYRRTDVHVRVYELVALLLSRTAKTFEYKSVPGKDNDVSVITFHRNGNRWQIVAMQNTYVKE